MTDDAKRPQEIDEYWDEEEGPMCDACCGEGSVEAQEYYNDYVNYGPKLIACPRCGGSGHEVKP